MLITGMYAWHGVCVCTCTCTHVCALGREVDMWKTVHISLLLLNYRLEDAARQLDELQSSREEEVSHLRKQLEGQLVEAKRTKEKMDEVVRGLKEEQEKKWALPFCTVWPVHCYRRFLSFPVSA